MQHTLTIVEEIRRVEAELRLLQRKQETAAWQRCRPLYLRDGDRNTAYFHMKAKERKKRNYIHKLEDSNGHLREGRDNNENVILEYYNDLFSSSRPAIHSEDVHMIDRRLTHDMAGSLDKPCTMEEIDAALKEMHPCKSPGLDGLPTLFNKRYWDLVGSDICSIVLNFLNNGVMIESLNYTHVV